MENTFNDDHRIFLTYLKFKIKMLIQSFNFPEYLATWLCRPFEGWSWTSLTVSHTVVVFYRYILAIFQHIFLFKLLIWKIWA